MNSVQEQPSPYDIIEQQNTTMMAALTNTGCVSADEGAQVNEVKSSKQMSSKKKGQLQRKRSPGAYNPAASESMKKK